MALGDDAQALVEALDAGGRAANPATLCRKLSWSERRFRTAADELCAAGVAERHGARLAWPVVGANVSQEAEMLLAALPADGSTVGGLRLRSSLDLDNETFAQAKRELSAAGRIALGRGHGGTVARAGPRLEPVGPARALPLVGKEKDLYQPFLDWLVAGLADQHGFAAAKIVATARGWGSSTGKWSRPDIAAIQAISYEWLPDITVEVRTYEIKRFADAQKLESVYEAAAHGRWAHRVSLVAELDPQAGALPDALLDEIRRFRLGLYVMRAREGGGFDIREEIEPPRAEDAQPEDVNELIGTFLGTDTELRNEYRRFIGR